jgi:Uncharacterized protein conserved in bacteria
MAVLGASTALAGVSRGQESMFDMFSRNSVLRDADRAGNISAAEALVATNEPILSYDTLNNLQLAISQYEPFVARGGWEEVPQEAYGLVLGNAKPAVVQLKRRLISSGDMAWAERINDLFDAETDRGLRTFQARHGLLMNGQVDEATWYALNVPAQQRLQQLYLNYTRVQNIASKINPRYVVVNIPRRPSRRSTMAWSSSATPRWSAASTAPPRSWPATSARSTSTHIGMFPSRWSART